MDFNFIGNFDSVFYNTIVTLAVGAVAILLYKKQKMDEKRDAARVVLMEIRHAEKQINQFKSSTVDIRIVDKVLLGDSWSKYCHLFVNTLSPDDLDYIADFYSKCKCIDRALNEMSISDQLKQKAGAYYQQIAAMAKECLDNADLFREQKQQFEKKFSEDPSFFKALSPYEIFNKSINNVVMISQSNAVSRIKKIGKIE